ncbi:MAG: hypothetical protein H7641_07575, partial [Candidatus Heimdallarchaeota archaeon]|nr:hypothetical protein [Candidatus Heimdallarchaeota archaeon]MCK4877423.1 hypothetical protein [Candidatus Heimdallarchaeota archaeon]
MKVELSPKKLTLTLTVISLVFVLSINSYLYSPNSNALTNPGSFDNPYSIANSEFNSQQIDSYIHQGFEGEYNPITNVSGVGATFTAKDVLTVYDDKYLNL